MTFDPADVLGLVQADWSEPSTFADTRVHHGYRRVVVVEAGGIRRPDLLWLLEPFAPVWAAWLSWIDPGGFVVRHVDGGPYRERWQLPITPDGCLNGQPQQVGVAFRVHHYEPHEVTNPGAGPRVVLVIDRDVLLDIPTGPFRVVDEEG